ncbi:MAG: hypothetical protein GQ582_07585 [Methyloprofundus sp.]|nr:hypothetical protein [Methyloprofundus sp.]
MSDNSDYVNLNVIADLIMGQSPRSDLVGNHGAGLPFLQGCAEFGRKNPLPVVYCNPPLRIATKGSILISVRAPVGKTNVADCDYCIGRGIAAIKGKIDKSDTSFLKYFIEANVSFLHKRSQGSTFLAISSNEINKLKISNISIDKQKKIATILISIDTAIKKTEALIQKYQQIKAGLMHDLFTRGVTADGKLRPSREQAPELYQETSIGWIPKGWDTNPFGERISIIDPNPSHRYPMEVDEGVPLCSTENFVGEDDFTLDKAKLVPIDTFFQQNNRCRFFIDDVIFARKGKIGLARRYGVKNKAFSHTVVIFKPRTQQTSSKWLLWLSRSDWLLKAINVTMNSNSGVPTLGVGFIGKIEVPFPGIEEQKLAAINLDAIALRMCRENQSLAKLQLQKQGLMQDLLTGKVRVKLDEPETANV